MGQMGCTALKGNAGPIGQVRQIAQSNFVSNEPPLRT